MRIHANEGTIEPRKYVLPRPFFDYLNYKAKRMAEILDSVSDKQQARIDMAFRENVGQFVGSDAYHAMLADLALFGDEAFSKRSEAPNGER